MRINHKILSIPPYLSVSWKHIASLSTATDDGNTFNLDVFLQDGSQVRIPSMDRAIVDAIFAAHAKYMESETGTPKQIPIPPFPLPSNSALIATESFSFPFPLEFFASEEIRPLTQHDSSLSDFPPLPQELMHKISRLAESLNLSSAKSIPAAEPHCNCPHCQITRCIVGQIEKTEQKPLEEEEISDQDLSFSSWIIVQKEQDLYEVAHPDYPEQYKVALKPHVHCSCNTPGCEHIKAVLSS